MICSWSLQFIPSTYHWKIVSIYHLHITYIVCFFLVLNLYSMAYTITIYDTKGEKIRTQQLNKDRFSDEMIQEDLMHEFFLLQRSNGRIAIAHTKTRGEIHGSGKKLYKQKWTGNARVGDKKSPVRRGGGVAFGPRSDRNFTKSMPQKMRRHALLWMISHQAKEKNIIWLEWFKVDFPKTKDAVSVLTALSTNDQKTLVVVQQKDPLMAKSFANIPYTKYILASYLNPMDILTAKKIILMDGVVDYLNTLQ